MPRNRGTATPTAARRRGNGAELSTPDREVHDNRHLTVFAGCSRQLVVIRLPLTGKIWSEVDIWCFVERLALVHLADTARDRNTGQFQCRETTRWR